MVVRDYLHSRNNNFEVNNKDKEIQMMGKIGMKIEIGFRYMAPTKSA